MCIVARHTHTHTHIHIHTHSISKKRSAILFSLSEFHESFEFETMIRNYVLQTHHVLAG